MSEAKTFSAYITKYALSSGILKTEVEGPSESGYFHERKGLLGFLGYSYTKKECHLLFEEAKARAEEMRLKKIASLKKQIAKLEKMTFEEPK